MLEIRCLLVALLDHKALYPGNRLDTKPPLVRMTAISYQLPS